MNDWSAVLNGSALCGGDVPTVDGFGFGPFGLTPFGLGEGSAFSASMCDACLKLPPTGLGVPPLRTEDQTYPQRDGVDHFADWYEPRILTFEATIGGSGCGCSGDARAAARRVAEAWSRQCDDVELVLWAGCEEEGEVNGPFGVIGRPRVADVVWRKGGFQAADALLRFDSVDHRLYILDADGTPGSGAVCETVASPGNMVYDSAVIGTAPYHYWPLDFPNVGTQKVSGVQVGAAVDLVGSLDTAPIYSINADGLGVPNNVAPISFGLSMSAVQGPAAHQGRVWTGGYTSGMVGWWQQTPVGATVGGSAILIDGSADFRVGWNAGGSAPSPVIKFGGSEVAMNADTQAAFGFTNTYHGQPVMILLVFVSGTLYIFAAHDGTSTPFLVQTVAGTGLPSTSGAPILTALSAKISNIMSGMDSYTATPEADGEAIMTTLAPYGFDTPSSQVTMPDVGQLCGPIEVTFEQGITFSEVYIFKADGSYVGMTYDDTGNSPAFLETANGTATRYYGLQDATADITGNPFLEIGPGEVLNVFGGGDITICWRPSVISA